MLRRGITPRDHHQENRALIAKISAKNHALRQVRIKTHAKEGYVG